jgi:Fe-S-cluster-containing hydrogenase component 2
MRVLPRWKAIKDIPGVLPCEDVREVFKEAEPIAVLNCPCKKIERHRHCSDEIPVETCIVCGKSAQYNLDRGAARKFSREEAVALVETLDEFALVHTTGNRSTLPSLICNCHNCCCGAYMRNAVSKEKINQTAIAKSRFIAEEDVEKCRGCRICIDTRCPVDAIEMTYYAEYNGERAQTDLEECIGCGLCAISCPTEARKMKLVRPPEHIPGVDDQPYAVY